jgi:hypothetical protein
MESSKTGNVLARFNVGDRLRVKELPNMFYSRTQMYVRGVEGTIAARTYEDLLPEDEAWNRDSAPPERFYIVRFRQRDIWEGYEDRIGETLYGRTPEPERQLLTLVHTLLRRGIVNEKDLARRMDAVRSRFEAASSMTGPG